MCLLGTMARRIRGEAYLDCMCSCMKFSSRDIRNAQSDRGGTCLPLQFVSTPL
jgi:hypothetical protein